MSLIETHQNGHIFTVTINRPDALNALTAEMHVAMEAAFDAFASDPTARICLVRGAGNRAFCAGSDLKQAASEDGYPLHGYGGLAERFDLAKPVIAVVNGFALGGGFEIALACDIIIASETASFGLPEPLVGAIALGGGLHRLARQIGLKRAMGMILTGSRVSAAEGLELGFVNEVVPQSEIEATVERWCAAILAGAPLAVEASKATVLRGLGAPSLADAIQGQQHYPEFIAWRTSEDLLEGFDAFSKKRSPRWRGR